MKVRVQCEVRCRRRSLDDVNTAAEVFVNNGGSSDIDMNEYIDNSVILIKISQYAITTIARYLQDAQVGEEKVVRSPWDYCLNMDLSATSVRLNQNLDQ